MKTQLPSKYPWKSSREPLGFVNPRLRSLDLEQWFSPFFIYSILPPFIKQDYLTYPLLSKITLPPFIIQYLAPFYQTRLKYEINQLLQFRMIHKNLLLLQLVVR